jgi:hypothetical protein
MLMPCGLRRCCRCFERRCCCCHALASKRAAGCLLFSHRACRDFTTLMPARLPAAGFAISDIITLIRCHLLIFSLIIAIISLMIIFFAIEGHYCRHASDSVFAARFMPLR